MVERDIALVRETGCPYHVCHVSTKETVDLVRQAKKEGLPVTCEVAPHYLYFTDLDLQDYGRFKMNPPIRSKEDQIALIEGLVDGTIDCIATDHAPHSAEEKSRGLLGSSNGVVGFETAFAASYTAMVKAGHMDLAQLIDRMAIAPGLFAKGKAPEIAPGEPANLVVLDPEAVEKVDASQFVSAGKATPFDGEMLQGQVLYTISKGEIVWEKERI
jgi:dihydroorotase